MKKRMITLLLISVLGITACQGKEQVSSTLTPTVEVTVTSAPVPTEAPTATQAPELTTNTPTPTVKQAATSTPVPTAEPTIEPTATNTPTPTIEPAISQAPEETEDGMKEKTTMELVRDMGIGINLGNTYEAFGDWIAQWGNVTPESYETAWGSPVITEEMIKGYADEGFGVLRVPVAWSNMMGDNYTINEAYAENVKEVVDWAIKYDLYVLVNLHYDNGWLEKFPTDKENCMEKYRRIWEQVSEIFKEYDEHLVFESQNEELGWLSVWNHYAGTAGKKESYALVNEINQTFVDVVRSSGGNNTNRHLLISGYNTDIDHTCDAFFEMPKDPANRCAVSVHYYTPSTFAILTEDADWGKAKSTWGTPSELKELEKYMDMLKKTFVDNGIPVIIGEYGCPTLNKEPESVRLFLSSVCREAYEREMCPVLWSTPGEHYDRTTCRMTDPELAKLFKGIIE